MTDAVGRRGTARVGTRWVAVLFAIAVLGLGAWGLWLHLRPMAGLDPVHRWLDLAYDDLQLFVLSSTPLTGGPYPWQLEVARFGAPLVTAYAVVEAVLVLLGERLARRGLRRRQGHTIVIGDSVAAHAIARGLTERNRSGVVLAASGDPETLLAHGLRGAAAIYACESEANERGINVATVLAAVALRPGGHLRAYAQVSDPALALTLRARRLGLAQVEKSRLDFFNVDEVAARLVVESTDFATHTTPRILIVGFSTFGRAVLIEFARHWRLRSPQRGPRAEVTVVDARARAAVAEARSQWPFVDGLCDISVVEGGVDEALAAGTAATPTTTYICEDDEQRALRTALGASMLWRGGPRSLVVRLDIMSRLGSAFHGDGTTAPQQRVLDDLGGRLLLVGVTEMAADTVSVIQQDLVERLAQAIHEQYLLSQLAVGRHIGDRPAMALWRDLSDELRNANRAQAGDIGPKLRIIDCTVAPYRGDQAPFTFRAAEVETLAEREHDRWVEDRYHGGWRYAAQASEVKRLSPAMLDWARLPNDERDKDRHAVRAMPVVLADLGLRIVRLAVDPADMGSEEHD